MYFEILLFVPKIRVKYEWIGGVTTVLLNVIKGVINHPVIKCK